MKFLYCHIVSAPYNKQAFAESESGKDKDQKQHIWIVSLARGLGMPFTKLFVVHFNPPCRRQLEATEMLC